MERTAFQLRWQTLSRGGDDLLATTGANAQNPRLGGGRLAEYEIYAARLALRWLASCQIERGWDLRRHHARGYPGDEGVCQRAAHAKLTF